MCDDCFRLGPLSRRGVLAAIGIGAVMGAGRAAAATNQTGDSGVTVAPGLTIRPRSAWDGGKVATRRIAPEDVKFLLVHHTASPNIYSIDGVVGILRTTYAYHTGPDKGWPDVAYHFFVDRFGGVWEGRTGSLAGPVRADATGGSQGFAQLVCLIGNFTDVMPTGEALDALSRTLAWLAARYDIDTSSGATVDFVSRGSQRWKKGTKVTALTISGHRDMSQTACPGDSFYPYVHTELQRVVDVVRRHPGGSTSTAPVASTRPTSTSTATAAVTAPTDTARPISVSTPAATTGAIDTTVTPGATTPHLPTTRSDVTAPQAASDPPRPTTLMAAGLGGAAALGAGLVIARRYRHRPDAPRFRSVIDPRTERPLAGRRTTDYREAVIELAWSAATDVGKVRSLNEDGYLARDGLFVVADGMGGHAAGEVASALAVEVIGRLPERERPGAETVAQRIADANRSIRDMAAKSPIAGGMGTTAVGLALVENAGHAYWVGFNVGDSRLYRFADGVLSQVSVDHSYVQELVARGKITPDEAHRHPERNVVTRALGTEPSVEPDFWVFEPTVGERFVLCSDGLVGEVDDAAISAVLAAAPSVDVASRQLVDRALAGLARDNITVVVVEVMGVEQGDRDEDTLPNGLSRRRHGQVPAATLPPPPPGQGPLPIPGHR